MNSEHLDLSRAPSILFLYGLVGSGKSYVGDLIASISGRYVYHADDDLTDELKLALKEKRPFTNDMRDRYFQVLVKTIPQLRDIHGPLVVTQGAYKRRHRDYILDHIPDTEMLCIDASDEVIAERLVLRGDGVSAASAAALRKDFESPLEGEKIIENQGGDTKLVAQLNQFYGK